MNQTLQHGDQVLINEDDVACKVSEFLGGGGQGEVYRANWKNKDYALKWYFRHMATDAQHAGLEALVRIGAPDKRFLWPLHVSPRTQENGFGYLMELRPPEYKSINDLMRRRADPTFRALATAGFQLADSFLQLHAKGLCYRDISFGNVFLNPTTGDVRICDNDNVGVNREAPASVLGTPRFMAPEIVRGAEKPSTDSDLFSLAVLLFYVFYLHHPLEGARESKIRSLDLPAMNRLYGDDPLYIFHPTETSNRPVAGEHDNAIVYNEIYPKFFRDLFERTFTRGIDDMHERTRESEWRRALIRLRDLIVYCPHPLESGVCRAENFYDADAETTECWRCKRDVPIPMRLAIGRQLIMLNYDTQLFPHHVQPTSPFDFSSPVAEVTQHPTNPNLWGLTNLTSEPWNVAFPDGTIKAVAPGKNAPLSIDNTVQFGRAEGNVQA